MVRETETSPWWQTRWFMLAAIAAAAIPLLWPAFPPLMDMPGHIGRYRILEEAGHGPLAAHYGVRPALIGNLGIDLLVLGLRPLLDVEPAAKLIVVLIPMLTVAAMLWVAKEAQGRIPASAGFALPLAYSYPFQLGFVNFCLAAGLSIAGLALWIRMARGNKPLIRALTFAPIACLLWLVHSFGWAMLGLFVFGAEWRLRVEAGERWSLAAIRAALMCLPMSVPVFVMLAHTTDGLSGDTGDWFHWTAKAQWVVSLLRERWKPWDVACVIVIAFLVWTAIRSRRMSFAPLLGVPALFGLASFVLMPRLYQGGSYVDMRILPYVTALALLAIRVAPGNEKLERRLAIGATSFFLARLTVTTVAFLLYAQSQQQQLGALAVLPEGAGILVLIDEPSSTSWGNPRFTHIAGIAIARKRVFTNEQWSLSGQQLIHPLHPSAAPLDRDPSQLVYPKGDDYRPTDFDDAIAHFDRGTFRYVWTIGFAPGSAHAADLAPIWSNGRSVVYRVTP
ncbi:MAG: hypothetical protein ABIO86_12750 [Sphingomonas sp.]